MTREDWKKLIYEDEMSHVAFCDWLEEQGETLEAKARRIIIENKFSPVDVRQIQYEGWKEGQNWAWFLQRREKTKPANMCIVEARLRKAKKRFTKAYVPASIFYLMRLRNSLVVACFFPTKEEAMSTLVKVYMGHLSV
jgi:hypothetical protein